MDAWTQHAQRAFHQMWQERTQTPQHGSSGGTKRGREGDDPLPSASAARVQAQPASEASEDALGDDVKRQVRDQLAAFYQQARSAPHVGAHTLLIAALRPVFLQGMERSAVASRLDLRLWIHEQWTEAMDGLPPPAPGDLEAQARRKLLYGAPLELVVACARLQQANEDFQGGDGLSPGGPGVPAGTATSLTNTTTNNRTNTTSATVATATTTTTTTTLTTTTTTTATDSLELLRIRAAVSEVVNSTAATFEAAADRFVAGFRRGVHALDEQQDVQARDQFIDDALADFYAMGAQLAALGRLEERDSLVSRLGAASGPDDRFLVLLDARIPELPNAAKVESDPSEIRLPPFVRPEGEPMNIFPMPDASVEPTLHADLQRIEKLAEALKDGLNDDLFTRAADALAEEFCAKVLAWDSQAGGADRLDYYIKRAANRMYYAAKRVSKWQGQRMVALRTRLANVGHPERYLTLYGDSQRSRRTTSHLVTPNMIDSVLKEKRMLASGRSTVATSTNASLPAFGFPTALVRTFTLPQTGRTSNNNSSGTSSGGSNSSSSSSSSTRGSSNSSSSSSSSTGTWRIRAPGPPTESTVDTALQELALLAERVTQSNRDELDKASDSLVTAFKEEVNHLVGAENPQLATRLILAVLTSFWSTVEEVRLLHGDVAAARQVDKIVKLTDGNRYLNAVLNCLLPDVPNEAKLAANIRQILALPLTHAKGV